MKQQLTATHTMFSPSATTIAVKPFHTLLRMAQTKLKVFLSKHREQFETVAITIFIGMVFLGCSYFFLHQLADYGW